MMKRIPSHWNIFLRESVFKLGRKELSLFCTGKITYFATSWNEGSQGKFSYREKILQLHLSWLSYKKFIPQLKEKLLFVFLKIGVRWFLLERCFCANTFSLEMYFFGNVLLSMSFSASFPEDPHLDFSKGWGRVSSAQTWVTAFKFSCRDYKGPDL